MSYSKSDLTVLLQGLDLGSSIAEQDSLLETARVETSVFSDLYMDKVDLIPGTKGSGKSALYRIFVDFLAKSLLQGRKVVVAHGVQSHGDPVFQAYQECFEELSEDAFVDFWCIYLVSLAHEQFVKDAKFKDYIIEFRKSNVTKRYPNGDGSLDARMRDRNLSWERRTRRLLA